MTHPENEAIRTALQNLIQDLIGRLKAQGSPAVAQGQLRIAIDAETRRVRITRVSDDDGGPEFDVQLTADEAEWLGHRIMCFGFALATVEREENGELN